jgi:biopolymer transport protein ExbD/biopolymer transport protein TolR
MQAAINITPLVDVVLVLLIIFMVMVPQMMNGPELDLPDTAKPTQQGDSEHRVLVSIDEAGRLWINDQPTEAKKFGDSLRAAVAAKPESKVVIRADAKLNFREVRQTMLAVEQAGFRGVGLIAQRAGAGPQGE